MKIGVPRETAPGEKRVATVPDVVGKLVKLGFSVAVESRAGEAANFPDEAYRAAGAEIVASAAELWSGSDIVFKSGQFDTSSAVGQRTLAHELTHVVQQRSGPVDGTDAAGGIRVSDPADRFEQAAEATAAAIMAQPVPAPTPEAAVQRDEEQSDGAAFVQRQAEEEEELELA